jgi:hypothetical protein
MNFGADRPKSGPAAVHVRPWEFETAGVRPIGATLDICRAVASRIARPAGRSDEIVKTGEHRALSSPWRGC